MSKTWGRAVVTALALAAVAVFAAGCGLFQGKQKDDPFNEPDKTSSTRSTDATTSATKPAATSSYESPASDSQTPAETYVEPARPWGAETRDNVNGQ